MVVKISGLLAAMSVIVHAQVCVCTHNQDVRRHAQSLAVVQASLARIPQCHVPLAKACLQVGQCQPQQSSETQRCKPELYQCV